MCKFCKRLSHIHETLPFIHVNVEALETGDKNARNEGLILLLCSVIKVSTNTNHFVNQMITENKDFYTSKAFLWYQCHRLYSVTDSTFATFGIFFTNTEVHLYKQMLYRDIWMETSM